MRRHKATLPDAQTRPTTSLSTWVILGFMLWVGFFIGAVILHAAAR